MFVYICFDQQYISLICRLTITQMFPPRPRLNPADFSQQMTTQEIQIALSFLKKRFAEYSLDQILLSLSQRIQSQQNNQSFQQAFPEQAEEPTHRREEDPNYAYPSRTRITHHNRDQRELRQKIFSISVNNEQKLNKFQQIRLVAKFFCQTGINFSLVRYFFPNITPQKYRAYIDTINNQTINQIQKFLRYQCNIQIQHLSTDQKRSLKTQLIKVRDWLGQKNVSQLQTYYKFIERHYQQKSVQVSYDEALKLYKTLLQIIKSPFVDIMEVIGDQPEQVEMQPPQRRIKASHKSAPAQSFTKYQQNRVIQGYLAFKTISKTSQHLNEKWGFSIKWSKSSIQSLLRYSLKKTIKKIILSRDKYLKKGTVIHFGDSQQELNAILQFQTATPIRQKLFKFYIANRITATGLTNIIVELNQFLKSTNSSSQVELATDEDAVSIIPKLQFQPKLQTHRRSDPIENRIEKSRIKEENVVQMLDDDKNTQNFNDKLTDATQQQIKEQPVSRCMRTFSFQQIIEID